MEPLVLIVLSAGFALALLIVVTMLTAVRADQMVTNRGPQATLAELDQRIATKRETLSDLDVDLQKRREALANVAEIQAEVDALIRQRDEILAEHAQLGERRTEIAAMREETEKAHTALAEATRDLSEKEADLARVESELAEARRLIANLDTMATQRDELEARLAQLRKEIAEAEGLRAQADALRTRVGDLERDAARLEGEAAALNARTDEAAAEARRAEERIGALRTEHAEITARLEADRQEAGRLADDIAARHQRVTELEARAAEIERDAARLNGEATALNTRRDEAAAEARRAEERIGALRTEHAEIVAKLEADRQETGRLADDITARGQRVTELEARAATLKARIAELTPGAGRPGASPTADPLKELRELPAVLVDLRKRTERALETEAEALDRVRRHLAALQLSYPRRVLKAFHTAMKVNETTQMTVLAGISGTGKSQLPRRYAEAMGIGFLHVPVQPRWDSPQDLMGFYNYIESRFRPTDMARALFHLDAFNGPEESADLQDRMLLVLLDEMNLARVEYYFSDFLSRLEGRPGRQEAQDAAARKDSEIELDLPMPEGKAPPRIFPGHNVLFAGTMNEDESTQSLSDKVVDRANVLRFAAPRTMTSMTTDDAPGERQATSRDRWQSWLCRIDDPRFDRARIDRNVGKMVDLMRDLERPMGYRLGRAIMAYVVNYPQERNAPDIRVPLADQVEMRLLPKLRGIDVEAATSALGELRTYVERNLGDTVLGQAIGDSIDASQTTGQFVWRGVTRE